MSQVNIADQAVSFLLAVALGASAGLLYCFFCALRISGRNKTYQVFVQDVLFWLLLTVATFCFLLLRCRGEVRGFVYAGMLAGFLLFRLSLFSFCKKAMLAVLKFVDFICRPIRGFFARSLALAAMLGVKILEIGKKCCKKFAKKPKKGLKAEQEVLYNNREFDA